MSDFKYVTQKKAYVFYLIKWIEIVTFWLLYEIYNLTVLFVFAYMYLQIINFTFSLCCKADMVNVCL